MLMRDSSFFCGRLSWNSLNYILYSIFATMSIATKSNKQNKQLPAQWTLHMDPNLKWHRAVSCDGTAFLYFLNQGHECSTTLHNSTSSHVMRAYFICISFEVLELAFQLINQLKLFLTLLLYLLIMIFLTLSTKSTCSCSIYTITSWILQC